MTGPPPTTWMAFTPGGVALCAPTTLRRATMPSFLCESSPTGQYTS